MRHWARRQDGDCIGLLLSIKTTSELSLTTLPTVNISLRRPIYCTTGAAAAAAAAASAAAPGDHVGGVDRSGAL